MIEEAYLSKLAGELASLEVNSALNMRVKSRFDRAMSGTAIIILAPALLVLALMVRMTGRSIIYAQERVGRNGELFKCYKFRTMYPDAEDRLKQILESDASLKSEWDTHFKLREDPRVTPIGRFLRKTSLDELPQLWNIWRGDMSIVGPRPVVVDELYLYGAQASRYISVKPGLTGLWQVSGRNDLTYDERVKLDATYVDNQSFALDCKIILKTFAVMATQKGAY